MAGKRSAVYGELIDSKGRGLPAPLEQPVVLDRDAYPIARIDEVISTLVDNAQSGAEMLREYTPMFKALMLKLQQEVQALLMLLAPPPTELGETPPAGVPPGLGVALDLAGKVSVILERLNKMTMQSVKSKDDAMRLRQHLTEGDSGRKDLESLSEAQLRRIVAEAASGWTKTD